MNYNAIGWPLEEFKFPNIFHTPLSNSKFYSFKLIVIKGQRTSVTFKV